MNFLHSLTPGEIFLLKSGSKATVSQILKYTLLDLIWKDVLQVNSIEKEDKAGKRVVYYLQAGSQFDHYRPLYHEKIFLRLAGAHRDWQYLFRKLVFVAHDSIPSEGSFFKKLAEKSPTLREYVRTDFLSQFLYTLPLNAQGKHAQQELLATLNAATKDLQDMVKRSPAQADNYVQKIKGNVFTLPDFDASAWKEFGELFDDARRQYLALHRTSGGGTTFSSCGGGTGCSGCNGCGGCGGCGGCS